LARATSASSSSGDADAGSRTVSAPMPASSAERVFDVT
jgi:hypothetical protein